MGKDIVRYLLCMGCAIIILNSCQGDAEHDGQATAGQQAVDSLPMLIL